MTTAKVQKEPRSNDKERLNFVYLQGNKTVHVKAMRPEFKSH